MGVVFSSSHTVPALLRPQKSPSQTALVWVPSTECSASGRDCSNVAPHCWPGGGKRMLLFDLPGLQGDNPSQAVSIAPFT